MNTKQIFIFTYTYPFNKPTECFFDQELRYISNKFDRVFIVPTKYKISKINQYNLEGLNNVKIINVDNKYSFKILLKAFFKTIQNYKKMHKETYVKKSDILKVLKYYYKNNILYYLYKREISSYIFKTDMDTVLYSYWFNNLADLVCLLKENTEYKTREIKAFSRAHGLGDLYPENEKYNHIRYNLKSINDNMNKIYTISENGVNYLVKSGIHQSIVKTSRLGISNVEYKTIKSSEDYFLIVSCSTLNENKNIALIINALSFAKAKDKIKWIHFGDGDMRNELMKLAKVKLSQSVEWDFAGKYENNKILKFYAEYQPELFINTSKIEGIPVSIMEACAQKIPIIATDVGATREIVKNEFNGYLIPMNIQPQTLFEIIEKFYHLSEGKKNEFRKNSYEMWKENYRAKINYENFAKEIVEA